MQFSGTHQYKYLVQNRRIMIQLYIYPEIVAFAIINYSLNITDQYFPDV